MIWGKSNIVAKCIVLEPDRSGFESCLYLLGVCDFGQVAFSEHASSFPLVIIFEELKDACKICIVVLEHR